MDGMLGRVNRVRRIAVAGVRLGLMAGLLLAAACAWAQGPSEFVASLPNAPGPVNSPGAGGGAQLTGVIEDAQGALIPGAMVTLEAQGATRKIASGSDGRFCFDDVPAGAFKVTAKEEGMEDGVQTGTLVAEQRMELDPMMLKVGATESVTAVTSEQMATMQVQTEETQRIGGIIPNYFVSYDPNPQPLTTKLKFELGWRSVIAPGNIGFVAAVAGIEQAQNTFPGYGQGASGYGKRFGAGMADTAVGTMLSGSILPVIFKQDPRYFYKGSGTIVERTWYALKTVVIAKGDNGKWQPAYANVLGSFGAGAVSNLYYPRGNRGVTLTLENSLSSLAFDGFSNVMEEFVLKHMTPKPRELVQ
jgi:hypothetical protein